MNPDPSAVLDALFPGGHSVAIRDGVLTGTGHGTGGHVAVLGPAPDTPTGVEQVAALARAVLSTVRRHAGRPLLLLGDSPGQRMTRRDEILGAAAYSAHLAQCLALARARGHRIVALVCREGGGGIFAAFAMQADALYALPGARIHTLPPEGIARITGMSRDELDVLQAGSTLYAPDAASFEALGAVDGRWHGPLDAHLAEALAGPPGPDRRLERAGVNGERAAARAAVAALTGG